jgi:hypothetical protein
MSLKTLDPIGPRAVGERVDEFCVCLAPIGLTTSDRRDKGTVSQDCYKAKKYTWMKVAALKIAAALYSYMQKGVENTLSPTALGPIGPRVSKAYSSQHKRDKNLKKNYNYQMIS